MAELKAHSGKFFEVIFRTEETQEDGALKKVKKTFAVNALSFAEAESKVTNEMFPYTKGDFEVVNINPAQYGEVFTSDDNADSGFYKCKISLITLDEKSGKEKKSKVQYLVQAASTSKAQAYIDKSIMGGSTVDYETASISETQIIEVLNG